MIRVSASHRLQDLVGALDEALPPPGRLFDGPWLVVPSRPVELYLDLALARRRGISGNLDTLSLRGVFARLCAAATPDVVLVDRTLLLGELLAVVNSFAGAGVAPELARPLADRDAALRPIGDYLRAGGTDADSVDRRRVEVARAFASLFDDWEQSRPTRMKAWRATHAEPATARSARLGVASVSQPFEPDHEREAEREASDDPRLLAAERRLWSMLHGPDGRFARRGRDEGRRYLTLADCVERGLDAGWAPPDAVHLFGFSELPRGWHRALERLAARTALSIYAYNPCREFWEDLDTRRRGRPAVRGRGKTSGARVSGRQLALGLFGDAPAAEAAAATPAARDASSGDLGEGGNPCLASWGRLGRDAARAWGQLGDGDSDARFGGLDGEPASTLLQAVQRDIVGGEPARTGTQRLDRPPDESLLLLRAPDARREIEAVAAEIWQLVRQDRQGRKYRQDRQDRQDQQPWRFSDVAVLVAGPDEPYRSLIPSVFQEASRLPHTVVDGTLASSSRLGEALLGLLALPLGPLTRREVLDVVTHPNVRARFPEADPAVWLALCEALGIARGADRRALGDAYLDRDAFSWDQGLRRLALGRFASGPRSGAEDPVVLPDPAGGARAPAPYLPAELAPDFRADADALGLLCRSLLADVRFARGASLSVAEWIRFVHALCDAYVVPLSADDEAARLHIFAALDRLAAAAAPEVTVSLTVARELVRDALGDLRGTRGQVFGNGVVVGSIGSLRTLPFRAVFVVGLGADRFPASARTRPLDPGGPRETGDATPAERDRYAFLQAVLAAEERLVLSAVDRDPSTGDARDPSAVVLELCDVVAAGYTRSRAFIRDVPKDRDQDPQVRAAFPAARAEAEARALGVELAARVPDAGHLDEAQLAAALSPAARQTLAPLFGLPAARTALAPRAAARTRAGRPRILRLADFRRFLECPLQGGARLTLGLRQLADDTEVRDATDEPFDVPRRVERELLAELFVAAWDRSAPPASAALAVAYDAAVMRQRVARVLPAGLFAASARQKHLALLEWWRAGALEVASLAGPPLDVCLGRPDGTPLAAAPVRADSRQALRFRVAAADRETELDVELRGRAAPEISVGEDRCSLLLSASPYARGELDELRLFVDHVALSASARDDAAPRPRRALILRPPDRTTKAPKASAKLMHFPPLGRELAQAYLASVIADIFSRTHDYLLPHEAVFMHAKDDRGIKGELVDCIAEVRDDPFYRRNATTAWGPVAEPFAYPIPASADACAMAERRFGLLFELRPPQRAHQKEAE